MGRSNRDDTRYDPATGGTTGARPKVGPATGDALKAAIKGAMGSSGAPSQQTTTPVSGAPTSPPSGSIAAGMTKLTRPTSNIAQGLASQGEQ